MGIIKSACAKLQRIYKMRCMSPLAREIKSNNLTYLSPDKLISVQKQARRVRNEGIPGDFMEFGVALGGTAILLASELDDRHFHGFDVFGMIPAPSEKDEADSHERYKVIRAGRSKGLGQGEYYGYAENLYQKVIQNFEKFGLQVDQNKINLHKGLFEETVHFQSEDIAALVHIDCDWYEPVKFCIESVSKIMSAGGIIIVDDYNDYIGCQNAVKDAISSDNTLIMENSFPHAIIRKY